MARTPSAFRTVFEAACRAAYGAVPTAASALEIGLLSDFNRTYQFGYDAGPADGWEDARVGSLISVTDRLIEWDQIEDGREFQIWTEDPRSVDSEAARLPFTTNAAGILLGVDAEDDEVWMSWVPETVKFDNTSWLTATAYAVGDKRVYPVSSAGACYRCLVAHTSGTFAADLASSYWVLMPVLSILEEFTVAYMAGQYLIRSGQPQTGYGMQKAARSDIDDKALREVRRNERAPKDYDGAATAVSASTPSQRYLRWLSGVTGLTGGGSANLDGIVTTSYTAGTQLVAFAINAEFQVWQLQAVSTAENAAGGIVRPDDYNSSTNLKTWIRIL